MSNVRVSYVRLRRMADELLGGQTKPPVDLDKIASRLGAEIRDYDLAADISGILFRDGERRVIVVNQHHSAPRKRFTVAHEIGHLALHRGEDVHVDSGFRINLRDPKSATAESVEEIEANAFAANLLMPASWLRGELTDQSIDLNDDSEVAALAEKYDVSVQAMMLRLTTLFG